MPNELLLIVVDCLRADFLDKHAVAIEAGDSISLAIMLDQALGDGGIDDAKLFLKGFDFVEDLVLSLLCLDQGCCCFIEHYPSLPTLRFSCRLKHNRIPGAVIRELRQKCYSQRLSAKSQ